MVLGQNKSSDTKIDGIKAQMGCGGVTEVSGHATYACLALLTLQVWPKCSRSSIPKKLAWKKILGPFEFAKVPETEKYETGFSALQNYNPNKRDLIGKSPKSF
jgi:hypothetical protein